MSFWKRLYRQLAPNPFDRLLKRAQRAGDRRFLICWNRGLGDIPLGLFALELKIRDMIPDAKVTFLTRSDLVQGFSLLPGMHETGVRVICDPEWKRGKPTSINSDLVDCAAFDHILRDPDPTYWVSWQIGKLTPKLRWQSCWDERAGHFLPEGKYVAVHVQTQTAYGYEKNWPKSYWQELFDRLPKDYQIVLFGFASPMTFDGDSFIDLRGKTELLDMLSILKNRCKYLIAPDSGVLSMAYYLDEAFALNVVSLWADPHQGILKQAVASPNALLKHMPLIAPDGDLSRIRVDDVLSALFQEERICT